MTNDKPTLGVPPFNRSPLTTSLARVLSTVPSGETIKYETISESLGTPRDRWQPLLKTARNIALEEHKIWFKPIPGIGLRHVPDDEMPSIGKSFSKHVGRVAKRVVKQLTNGVKNYASLPREVQNEINTQLAHAGVLHHVSKPSSVRVIRGAAETANGRIPAGLALALLRAPSDD